MFINFDPSKIKSIMSLSAAAVLIVGVIAYKLIEAKQDTYLVVGLVFIGLALILYTANFYGISKKEIESEIRKKEIEVDVLKNTNTNTVKGGDGVTVINKTKGNTNEVDTSKNVRIEN